jgi:large subunit ribosomal protein L31
LLFHLLYAIIVGMKANIHPTYHTGVQVTCACGNKFTTGSTKDNIHVEICSNCHPFYTGKQKLIDTAGTVDKFKKRAQRSTEVAAAQVTKKPRKTKADKKSEA